MMIYPPNGNARAQSLNEFLSDQVRELQSEACALLNVAASRRSTARRLEEPVRRWETRTRVHPGKGKRWEASLSTLTAAIAAASAVYRRIYEAESQALPLITAGIEKIRRSPSGNESRIPDGVLRMLEISSQLQSDSLAAIERALAVSSQIGAFNTRSTAPDVLALLDDRRRAIAESEACRNRANAIVRRAFRLDTDRIEDMESAAVRALGAEDEVVAVRCREPGAEIEEAAKPGPWLRLVEDGFEVDPAPRGAAVAESAGGGELDQEELAMAIARLNAAESRLEEAIAGRDRALALVRSRTRRATS